MTQDYNLAKHPYQSNVVGNYRFAFENKYGIELKLSDQDIWEIQDSILAATGEEQDEQVLEALFEENPA